jgi:hypothetical protein
VPGEVDRLYFLHLPKAAGSTLTIHLRSRFRAEEICPAQLWYELVAIPPAQRARLRLFAGHFCGALPNFEPGPYTVVTMLRDPVERAWSHFRFVARIDEHPLHALAQRGLEAFVADPVGRQLVGDVQARQLAIDAVPPEWRRPADERDLAVPGEVLFDPAINALPDDELVARALARLDACDVVGVTDELHASVQLVAYACGWDPVPPLPELNAAPDRQGPTDAERTLLTEHNQLDARVYAAARERFARDHLAMADALLEQRVDAALAARTTDLRGRVTVDFGTPFRGQGWVFLQPFRDGAVRWTGPEGARVDVPVRVPAGTKLELLVPAVLTERIATDLVLEVNGQVVALTPVVEDGAFLYSGVVPAGADGPFTRIRITTPETAPFPEAVDGMVDDVRVGLSVAWIRLTAP